MTAKPLPPLSQLQHYLAPRKRDAHKGDFGTVLVIGGALGMSGAPLMAAMAAQRAGAGKVIIATDPQHAAHLVVNAPSVMAYGVKNARALQPLLALASVIVIGPGLSQSAWSKELLASVLQTSLPMVVDADALNLLAKRPIDRTHWVLTPHVGEAARLLACHVDDILLNRENAAIQLQKKYGGEIVLKGADTLVTTADASWVCHAGNPGMATAGMGDILSGVIGGLIAQQVALKDAAQLGVCIHAHAGDLAAKEGMRGMIATDLLPFIRQLVNVAQ
jgi:NAD(P)H-hydrate epimerase